MNQFLLYVYNLKRMETYKMNEEIEKWSLYVEDKGCRINFNSGEER